MMKTVKNDVSLYGDLKKLPETEHWAILYVDSITYDDGYGSNSTSTKNYIEYIAFADVQALKAWVRDNDDKGYGKKIYRVINVKPATVTRTVNIELE